jgi:hypothetical protein
LTPVDGRGGLAILTDAQQGHRGPEAAGFSQRVFLRHEATGIRQLMSAEDLRRQVQVEANTGTVRVPTSKKFLWQQVHRTPFAGMVAVADGQARAVLEHEVVSPWPAFGEDVAFLCPQRIVAASAGKQDRRPPQRQAFTEADPTARSAS